MNIDELAKEPEAAQVAALQAYQAAAIIHVFPNQRLARLAQKPTFPCALARATAGGTGSLATGWWPSAAAIRPYTKPRLNLQLLQPLGLPQVPDLLDVAKLVRLRPVEALSEPFQQLLQARQLNQAQHHPAPAQPRQRPRVGPRQLRPGSPGYCTRPGTACL
ncbi:hypothetical protein ACFQT0_08130 [Hymenobacter humi]|uniref:Uncharacterized protein n=1 Tax=Hymenobacter humi TaxID=1411620 RepID=A0ABW2U219_9BACT